MNNIKHFLKAMRKITRKFGEDHLSTGVMDQDLLMPRESVVAAPETKGRLQDAEHDKKLIENINRVTPFLRKESGHHSSSEQQSRK